MSRQSSKAGTSGQNVPKSKFRHKSQQEQTAASKLRMEKRGEQLDAARDKLAKQKPPKRPGPVKRMGRAALGGVHGFVHGKIYEVEHENVGTEGAHRSELVAESTLRHGKRFVQKKIREHPAKAVRKAESRHLKAAADYHYRKTVEEHQEMQGSALSRYVQKQKIKRQYAKQAKEAAKQGAKAAEKTAVTTEKLAARTAAFVKRHPVGVLLFLALFLLLVLMQSCMSSLVTIGNGAVGAIGASTYAAEDADLLGAEAAYCALEDELREYLDTYEATHDYDEYHFDLDDIEHDPYVLLSLVSAWHERAWTLAEVQDTLQMLFDRQYILTESVVVEVRYQTETDTWTDEEGNTHTDTYQVSYNYYICTVTLENFNLSHLPIYIMGEDQLSRYALYMATLGNRPDLFPSSPYVAKYTGDPVEHEKPLPLFSPRPRNTSAIPMCGAGTAPAHPLTAPASCPMSTTNAAGTSGGWGRRGFTTSVPAQVAHAPAILCSSPGLMTPPVFLIAASMWAMAGCSIVAIPSNTPTSIQATGSHTFTPTGDFRKGGFSIWQ